jgi:starvation-inducible DNA-binding protein
MSKPVTDALSGLLADYQILYQKLRNYHWNVTGERFFELHTFFETQYTALAVRIDDIAERLRYLNATAPGSYATFLKLTCLSEDSGVPPGRQMVENLMADYTTVGDVVARCQKLAGDSGDAGTVVLLDEFLTTDQKSIWMMRAFLN